jgi:hypothetical protein
MSLSLSSRQTGALSFPRKDTWRYILGYSILDALATSQKYLNTELLSIVKVCDAFFLDVQGHFTYIFHPTKGILFVKGECFPSIDHLVPADIIIENYIYFLNTLREIGSAGPTLQPVSPTDWPAARRAYASERSGAGVQGGPSFQERDK